MMIYRVFILALVFCIYVSISAEVNANDMVDAEDYQDTLEKVYGTGLYVDDRILDEEEQEPSTAVPEGCHDWARDPGRRLKEGELELLDHEAAGIQMTEEGFNYHIYVEKHTQRRLCGYVSASYCSGLCSVGKFCGNNRC